MSAAMEKYGVKVTFIQAGEHKTDGNPYQELPKAVKDNIQANVDLSMDAFVALVVRNRGMTEEAVRGTQAAIYRAKEAMSLGLVDAVEAPSKAIAAYQALMSAESNAVEDEDVGQETPDDPDNSQELNMEPTQTPGADTAAAQTQALQEAADAARVQERARMSGIMGCEEAKGREGLANHFAMNTNMSVEDAKAALAAAPVAQAAASEVTSELNSGKNTAFHQAMDLANHPNVGADTGAVDAGGEQAKDPAAGILAAQAKASGRAIKAKA
jgi:ClpP class serine protease